MVDEARVNALCEKLGKGSMMPDEVEATLNELHELLGAAAYGKVNAFKKTSVEGTDQGCQCLESGSVSECGGV
jgi:hypothetical protein